MTRKVLLFELTLIAAACVVGVAAFPHLPNRIPIHWNVHLRPNRYGPKWVIFLLGPGMMAGVTLFTSLGPWLSPKRFEVDNFRSTWRQLMLMVFCLIGYIYAAMLWADFHHRVDAGRMILGGASLMVVLMGNLMGKVRKNFFIGVRTPWTLASDRTWNATHRFAARTWMAGGLFGLLFTVIWLPVLSISSLLAGVLAPYVYSLVVYKRQEEHEQV
jgi:uncharacterized membrane protein